MPRLILVPAVVVVLALAGCSNEGARLNSYPPGSGGSIALDKTPPGTSYPFDDIRMCVEGEGEVTVVAAEPIDPLGGMQITRFSVLPADSLGTGYLDGAEQSLTDAGFPTEGAMVVDQKCAGDPTTLREGEGQSVFGIEVSRTAPDAGSMRGVRVTYESNGARATVDYPLGIVLCRVLFADAARDVRSEGCEVETIAAGQRAPLSAVASPLSPAASPIRA